MEETQKNIISIELERAIRVIIGLKETTKQHKDTDGKIFTEKIDLAKTKAEEFSSLEEFTEYALAEAKLDDRVYDKGKSKISFDKSDDDAKKMVKN